MTRRIVETKATVEGFHAMLDDRGLAMEPERVKAAAETHDHFRHELDKLRSVRLRYLPPYIEPATAVQWIENGGHSVEPLGTVDPE